MKSNMRRHHSLKKGAKIRREPEAKFPFDSLDFFICEARIEGQMANLEKGSKF
ncbi:MAG: hypothetical protein WCB58_21950 [Acidobacteriaceae bacterium]